MKTFILSTLFTIGLAQAGIDECLRDAKTHGSHTSPLSPSEECADLIKAHPEKLEIKTSALHLYGLKHMVYVEVEGNRKLLAGDQTELKDIYKFYVNENKKIFLIQQKDSVSTFQLDFIGNVSPLSYFQSPILRKASAVKLLDNEDMIAIFSSSGIRIINSNAETRHNDERLKPKLLKEIVGKNSDLNLPSDIIVNRQKKMIYVLDSNRLLIFPLSVQKNQAPLKVIKLVDAHSLKEINQQLFYVNSKGQETNLSPKINL